MTASLLGYDVLPSLGICVVEKELGQSAYALPQLTCF